MLEAPLFDGEPIEVDRASDESRLNASSVSIDQRFGAIPHFQWVEVQSLMTIKHFLKVD